MFWFLMGLAGALGLIFSWPVHILWILLLVFGWGIFIADCD